MNPIILELIFVVTVALGLGFWQLYDVNKEIKKDARDHQGDQAKDAGEKKHDEA